MLERVMFVLMVLTSVTPVLVANLEHKPFFQDWDLDDVRLG